MIASLSGTLAYKSPTEIVVDVRGVGYHVLIPLSTFEQLGAEKTDVRLLTYLHVRDDAMQLFGFATEDERTLFKLLISVTGIGPKMAQGILSGVSVVDLRDHITRGNLAALTAIPGIGRKLAERLIVELRDKIGKTSIVAPFPSTDLQTRIRSEALLALTSLGYNRAAAEKALRTAIQESNGKDVSVEVLIKTALRHAAK
ncbi:MAG: Holliday junction branch migration protein RuvA [Ignavibacteriae bacterium]|nr:Holliday junction branch migration protein RuvA [Ignavibacteriota bacterium]